MEKRVIFIPRQAMFSNCHNTGDFLNDLVPFPIENMGLRRN